MAINPISFSHPQINSLVDQGQWDRLGNLGNLYREAQNRERLSDLGRKLAAGEISYQQAAGEIGQTGDIGSTLKFLELSEGRRLQDLQIAAAGDFAQSMRGMYGGAAPAAPTTRAAVPEPTQTAAPPPREPVAEIPGVVRTNPDGTIAGNITAPSIPAQEPPPVPPDQAALPPKVAGANATSIDMLPPEQRVPILIRAASSPFLPTAQRDVAKSLLTDALGQLKPHERTKFLEDLSQRPDLMAIEEKLAKARSTQVNVNPGQKKYAETVGKEMADKYIGIQNKALAAPRVLGALNIMERALKDPNFVEGGPLLESRLAFQRALSSKAFGGISTSEGAAATELFQKASNKMLIDMLGGGDEKGGGLGAGFSNTDRTFYEQAGPNLGNSIEGNRLVIEMTRRGVERDKVVAKMARDYLAEQKARGVENPEIDHEFLNRVEEFAEKNPVFAGLQLPAEKPAAPAAPAEPTRAEIEAEMARRRGKK